jgi:hypothetical protein
MVDRRILIQEIETLPPDMMEKLSDYIGYLKSKKRKLPDSLAAASESALAKEWLLPAEDEAWADL